MSNFITAAEVLEIAFERKNISESFIKEVHIEVAEDRHIRPALTQALFDRLNQDNTTLTTKEVELKGMVKNALAYYVRHMALPNMTYQATNKGVQLLDTDHSRTGSEKNLGKLLDNALNMGQTLMDKAIRFIESEENKAYFPLYKFNGSANTRVRKKGGMLFGPSTTTRTYSKSSETPTPAFSGNPSDLNQEGATTGQILRWNGTDWVPDNETPGGGGGFSGHTYDLLQDGALDTQVLAWSDANSRWEPTDASAGAQGPQGPAGADGDDGLSAYEIAVNEGFTGTVTEWLNSLIGPEGPQGPQGEQGIQGIQGPAGTNGTDGTDGDSAYQIWLNNGNVGTEADYLASLIGPEGPQGPQGIQGVKGDTGDQGPQGIQGIQGEQGPQGPQGPAGEDGVDGVTPTGSTTAKTANYSLQVSDFDWMPSEISVGTDNVTITLPAIVPTDGHRCELNLYSTGSITLDASAVTIVDSSGALIASAGAISVQAAVIIYNATVGRFKLIGKYTP